jgi:hypothetical protein
MRIHITLTEYENEPDGTVVTLNTHLPDGASHYDVTELFNRALSSLYGYEIGTPFATPTNNYTNPLDPEDA